MKSVFKQLGKISFEDVKCVLMLMVTALPALVLRLVTQGDIWLIVERVDNAEDNGWIFYQWLRKNRPEQPAYFALDKAAPAFDASDSHILPWGGFRHYMYYLAARVHIRTMFVTPAPSLRVCSYVERFFRKNLPQVYLRHGISTSGVEHHRYEVQRVRIFICGAKPEYDYISQNAGYPDGYVHYTGFARFDDLLEHQSDGRFVLIMPSWRRYIDLYTLTKEQNEQRFLESAYYQHFNSLLNNTAIIDFLENAGYKVKFCIHAQFKKFLHLFSDIDPRIEIVDDSVTIHDLLMATSLLITDYSSVLFDVAYMQKPMIFYQFDFEEFRQKHFSEGYFSYKRDAMGPVVENQDELFDAIKAFYNGKDIVNTEYYIERCNKFFPTHDNNNCERIYNAIRGIKKRN